MKNHCLITIGGEAVGRTPRQYGVNVEIQDHAGRTNLWDWLAASNITCVREFHPDRSLRRNPTKVGRWDEITGRAEFEAFRERVRRAPDSDAVDWGNYLFDEAIPWIGVPDEIAGKLGEMQIQPLYALGYGTADFPRPLITEDGLNAPAGDEQIDWAAAASAYDYYFAVIYHFASRFGGRYFMMMNEPENQKDWFHWPDDVHDRLGDDWRDFWVRVNWEDDELNRRIYAHLSVQFEALARIARWALEDVRGLLTDPEQAAGLQLSGPTNVLWGPLWNLAWPHLDTLDFHHYHTEATTFQAVHRAAATAARRAGPERRLAISEFNRLSGGVNFREILFDHDNALNVADLLMTVLSMTQPGDPDLEFIALYLLGFPSTHRNYKHLLYGDMNLLDWTTRDRPLWGRGENWYPTFDELQLRWATPAWFVFRMLGRLVSFGQDRCGPHAILPSGWCNPTSSGPGDLPAKLRVLAVRQGRDLLVTLLNPGPDPAAGLRFGLEAVGGEFRFAVVRELSPARLDAPVAAIDLSTPMAPIEVPARSLTQVIFTPLPLGAVEDLQLTEPSRTPGGLAEGLELWQTTRLVCLGRIAGREVDLSDLCISWSSSQPESVRVLPGGLVQRIRASHELVTITARLVDTDQSVEVALPA